MSNPPLDRRVQRTRQLLHQAMVSLMLEKGYEKITIQDILDRANIGRSTFYAHYRDKEDLLLRGVANIAYGDEVEASVQQHIEDIERHQVLNTIITTPMFTHVQQNRLLHEAMYSKSKENPILEKGTALLYANTKAQIERLIEGDKETSVPVSAIASFLTGGLMSLIKWWMDQNIHYSPQQMDELFQKIAMPGVREVLGK